jgi:hypothetical protein
MQGLTLHEMNHHKSPLSNSMDVERTIDETSQQNMKIFYIYLFISHDAEHPVQL